jgi:hypothetical protein
MAAGRAGAAVGSKGASDRDVAAARKSGRTGIRRCRRAKARRAGWRDGDNLHIDYRWISGVNAEQMRAQAADLVATAPDVLWVLSNPMLAALMCPL